MFSSKHLSLVFKPIQAGAVILPVSLVIFTHKRGLIPLYGSGPTTYLLHPIVLTAVVASAVQPLNISRTWNFLYIALALTAAPNATYWVAVLTARNKDPLFGPVITHTTTLCPLVFLLAASIIKAEVLDRQSSQEAKRERVVPLPVRLIRASFIFLISTVVAQRFWERGTFLYNVSDSQIYLALAAIFYNFWISSVAFNRNGVPKLSAKAKRHTAPSLPISRFRLGSLAAFNVLWWTTSWRFANPTLPHPLPHPYRHPTYPLEILSAEQSVTGLITVGEWLPLPSYNGESDTELHSARYLRASHSILGGVWTRDKVQTLDDEPPLRDSFGSPLGDSIYSTFVLQEAARLVNSTKAGKSGNWKEALIIGLGTGISATSFMQHDISTTIVEIDPAVYKAARTYFGLPDPGPRKIYLEDARVWAAQYRNKIKAVRPQFDIVVHDCFSGGGVPKHIFTTEFWDDLKAVMEPEAILVVNFAGILRSQSSRLIINTLERSFGQCRAFHDTFDTLLEEKYSTEFVNMVLFCTQSTNPLTFRKSRRSDWLGSPLRRHVLQSLEAREVNLDSIREIPADERFILTDKNNPLGALQAKQGNHHWLVMREVLPDIQWETF